MKLRGDRSWRDAESTFPLSACLLHALKTQARGPDNGTGNRFKAQGHGCDDLQRVFYSLAGAASALLPLLILSWLLLDPDDSAILACNVVAIIYLLEALVALRARRLTRFFGR
ncbi:hypothetical protein [Burkholderia contaminans]|uniref:hypothetical protein n=1 Tax=Burkholderia contaminans TaxID=488447 RepID=UPI000F596BA7|nr:hypothetical protein [Burkholderia contaminans]